MLLDRLRADGSEGPRPHVESRSNDWDSTRLKGREDVLSEVEACSRCCYRTSVVRIDGLISILVERLEPRILTSSFDIGRKWYFADAL